MCGAGDDLRADLNLDFKTACFGGEEKVPSKRTLTVVSLKPRKCLGSLQLILLISAGKQHTLSADNCPMAFDFIFISSNYMCN